MAVPKRKTSKARKHSRGTANINIVAPTLVECPQCHEMKVSHKICIKCGYYDGEQIINVEKKKAK